MATYKLQLRKNKTNKEGKHPIIFTIFQGNKSKIITLPYSCSPNQWDKANKRFRKNHPKHKAINEHLIKLDIRLQNSIYELEALDSYFDLQDVVRVFKDESSRNKVKLITVKEFFTQRIKELESINSFGYAKVIKDTQNSLFKFAKQDLKFKDITPKFLNEYDTFLRKTYSNSGIAIRMRDIRAAYNKAIVYGNAKESDYPFNGYKISKLKPSSRKIAMTNEDLQLFKSFNIIENPRYEDTYNMFLFSYYAGGMNFKDMTHLRWDNVKEGRLVYKRAKTKGEFNLKLFDEALKILSYYKQHPKSENTDYIFPIINKYNLTEKQEYGRYKRCIRKFNKELNFISESVGIEKNLTSYVARHSFATHLKFENIPEDVISELMGHSSVAVTKSYLKDFGSGVLDDAMSKLN